MSSSYKSRSAARQADSSSQGLHMEKETNSY